MTITNYDQLRAEVRRWAARSDTAFNDALPSLIMNAESRIFHGFGREGDQGYSQALRAQVMESDGTVDMTDGSGALPSDYLGMRAVFGPDGRPGLDYLSPRQFGQQDAYNLQGTPLYYTVEGMILKFSPAYTGDVSILYWKQPRALTPAQNENVVLTAHPAVYFNAVMVEAWDFMRNTAQMGVTLAKYNGLVRGINSTAKAQRTSGSRARRRAQPGLHMP